MAGPWDGRCSSYMQPYNQPGFLDAFMAGLGHLKRFSLLILGSMLLLSAALMLVGGLLMWVACRNWPRARGQITKLELVAQDHPRSTLLDLEYEFTVQGQQYTGTMLSPFASDNVMHRWLAWWKARTYSVGEPVEVMYRPNDLSTCFVERPTLLGCLLRFFGISTIGGWMVFLFFQFRRRTVPEAVLKNRSFAEPGGDGVEPMPQVLVLRGISSHEVLGSLLSGWPQSHAAIVVDQTHFLVVAGPYSRMGIASSFFTLSLLVWLKLSGMLWLHLLWETQEVIVRRLNWNRLRAKQFDELKRADPIAQVTIYGLEPDRNRFWYRIERRKRDEFIEIAPQDRARAEHLVAGFNALVQSAAGQIPAHDTSH